LSPSFFCYFINSVLHWLHDLFAQHFCLRFSSQYIIYILIDDTDSRNCLPLLSHIFLHTLITFNFPINFLTRAIWGSVSSEPGTYWLWSLLIRWSVLLYNIDHLAALNFEIVCFELFKKGINIIPNKCTIIFSVYSLTFRMKNFITRFHYLNNYDNRIIMRIKKVNSKLNWD